jgi:hypothetical protein
MYALMFILNLFPIAWIVARLGGGLDRFAEPLNMFCNFSAKVCESLGVKIRPR